VVDSLELRYRVGSATGEVIITTIGHPTFAQDDIFGEPVDLAFQMLGRAKCVDAGYCLCPTTLAETGQRV